MSEQRPFAAHVELGPDGPRFSCARCAYTLKGLGAEGGEVRCPECGFEQRLAPEAFSVYSRFDIIASTVLVWIVGGVVAFGAMIASGLEGALIAFIACVIAPSLIFALLLAPKINRPIGLTRGGKIACAIWWWFLGTLISFILALLLLVPATIL